MLRTTIPGQPLQCIRCNRVLPITEFSKEFVLQKKPHPLCRACKKKQLKALAARWAKERLLRKDLPREKECKRCHRIKPVSEFFNSMAYKDGRSGSCKRCMTKKNNELKQHWKDQRAHIQQPTEKLCLQCYQLYPMKFFCQTISTKDGHESICKNCLKKRRKAYSQRWMEERQTIPAKTMKTCPGCKRALSPSAFYMVPTLKDGLNNYCKECSHRMTREYAEKWEQQRKSHPQILIKKTCNLCHRSLPLSQFYPYRRTKTGYSATCIACESRRTGRYIQQWSEQQTTRPREKQCKTCKKILPADQFRRNKRKKDGLDYNCKKCSKALLEQYSKRWSQQRAEQGSDFSLFPSFEKTCSLCHKTLPLTMFYTRKLSRDGHNASCKECDQKHMKGYLEKQKKSPKIVPKEKTCSACHRRLPASDFNKNLQRPSGLDIYCKSCHNKKQRAYRSQPEFRTKMREWRRKYVERPEVREKTRKRARKYAQRPDRIAKRKAYQKQHRMKPEVILQTQKYSKEYYQRKKKLKQHPAQ